MRPSFWSKRQNRHLEDGQGGWERGRAHVKYTVSEYTEEINALNPGTHKKYFTASFNFDFEYTGDEVYVAYTVPYTYSQI